MYRAFLVVACLPCAAQGRWVNNEDEVAHDSARVLAALLLGQSSESAFSPSGSARPFANLSPKAMVTRNGLRPHRDPRMLFGGGDGEEKKGGGGMMEMMKQAKDMMSNPELMKKYSEAGVKMQELQKELAETEIECSTKDGGVTITITGTAAPVGAKVTDDLCSKSAEEASAELTNALLNAHRKSTMYAQQQMAEVSKGLGLDDEALAGLR